MSSCRIPNQDDPLGRDVVVDEEMMVSCQSVDESVRKRVAVGESVLGKCERRKKEHDARQFRC